MSEQKYNKCKWCGEYISALLENFPVKPDECWKCKSLYHTLNELLDINIAKKMIKEIEGEHPKNKGIVTENRPSCQH